jgi:hypothetical protein
MSSTVNVNQLARKDNLVVHLDVSPSSYTAHPFNSDAALSGTNTSVLTWPNRWIDLSGNNNHAYPCTNTGIYNSSANFPLTSSYLNNNIYFNNSFNNFRLNPIQETTGPLSIFLWVRRRGGGGSAGQWLINKRTGNFNEITSYYQITVSNTTGFSIAIANQTANGIGFSSANILDNVWYNIGFTIEDRTSTSIARGYLNGVQLGSPIAIGNAGMPTGSQEIIIGKQTWSTTGNANVDMSQVLIYNVALTPQEVWNNYQITKYKHQA